MFRQSWPQIGVLSPSSLRDGKHLSRNRMRPQRASEQASTLRLLYRTPIPPLQLTFSQLEDLHTKDRSQCTSFKTPPIPPFFGGGLNLTGTTTEPPVQRCHSFILLVTTHHYTRNTEACGWGWLEWKLVSYCCTDARHSWLALKVINIVVSLCTCMLWTESRLTTISKRSTALEDVRMLVKDKNAPRSWCGICAPREHLRYGGSCTTCCL